MQPDDSEHWKSVGLVTKLSRGYRTGVIELLNIVRLHHVTCDITHQLTYTQYAIKCCKTISASKFQESRLTGNMKGVSLVLLALSTVPLLTDARSVVMEPEEMSYEQVTIREVEGKRKYN